MGKRSKLAIVSLFLGITGVLSGVLLLGPVPDIHGTFGGGWGRVFSGIYGFLAVSTGSCAVLLGAVSYLRAFCCQHHREDKVTGAEAFCLGLIPLIYLCMPFLSRVLSTGHPPCHESWAVCSLRTIATQEGVFSAQVEVDQDLDGVGEYGYLCELSGEITPRNKFVWQPVCPVYISSAFKTRGSSGTGMAEKCGYYYRLYLPGRDGLMADDRVCDGTPTRPSSLLDPAKDGVAIDGQEKGFVVYAWPVKVGETGHRCFVVTKLGEVHSTKMENRVYSGDIGPRAEAALFLTKDQRFKLASGDDNPGCDGNTWNSCEP